LARIIAVEVSDAPPVGYDRFEIRHSVAQEGRYQLISPDIATCDDCRRELLDPDDRRYRYPFTNCTNCGPRFTIIRDIPYDRPLTTMQPFPMCPDCQREYDDPLDRRFHAQPNACPVCGPHVWLEGTSDSQTLAERDAAMRATARMLLEGKVVAIKGLGGFHLACDATSAAAVATLRQRKGRPAKPLAVMMADMEMVRHHCHVRPEEEELLLSQQCPIVLLPWRDDSTIVPIVAPHNLYLGVMLPYTPLHHILLHDVGRPLVMTSGNLSEEPIARSNEEARQRLGHLADAFLMHNREIYARYDDSVWFVPHSLASGPAAESPALHSPQPIRRSRGYAPFPIRLPFPVEQILAVGAELKNTFCLTRDDFAFLSQHIGDMENLETLEHLETSIELFKHLFRLEPGVIAHDLHPDYFSTKYANEQMGKSANGQMGKSQSTTPPVSKIPIQHHEAHVAACLADNAWTIEDGPVIGVVWDGTGYGLDGHIWGGEFLVSDYRGFRRAAYLEYLPLPGGDAAVRNPWRLALGYHYALTGQRLALPGVSDSEAQIVCQQIERRINTPLTSAAGRLFDAVSALLGVQSQVTYEGQAAIELEMLATRWASTAGAGGEGRTYPFELERQGETTVIRLRALWEAIQADQAAGVSAAALGWRFHDSLAALLTDVCQRVAAETGLRTVALSGGCFQNRLLLSLAVPRLEEAGFRVLLHRQVPCNDGGLSLGQAVLAHFCQKDEQA